MAEPKQPPAPNPTPGTQPVRSTGGAWTEEEKGRGAGQPGRGAGAAGDASTKGRPTDDRARTEGAAGGLGGRGAGDAPADRPAPDPDTPVVGGKGHRSMGGSATEPEPEADPQAPRNPL